MAFKPTFKPGLTYSSLKKLEEFGRAIASDKNSPVSDDDIAWLYETSERSWDIGDFYRKSMGGTNNPEERLRFLSERDFAEHLDTVALHLRMEGRRCQIDAETRGNCRIPKAENFLKLTDEVNRMITGEKCTWLLQPYSDQPYTYSSGVNDFTACFHRMIERFDKVSEYSSYMNEGKCWWKK